MNRVMDDFDFSGYLDVLELHPKADSLGDKHRPVDGELQNSEVPRVKIGFISDHLFCPTMRGFVPEESTDYHDVMGLTIL